MARRQALEATARIARVAQEHVIRYVATLVFVGCAIAFCVGLGEDSGSTSIGLVFGALFGAVPAGWLWAREFYNARVEREREEFRSSGTRLVVDEDVDEPREVSGQGATVRSISYYDEDDD